MVWGFTSIQSVVHMQGTPGTIFLQVPSGQVIFQGKTGRLADTLSLSPIPSWQEVFAGCFRDTQTLIQKAVGEWEWKIPKFLNVQHAVYQQLLWELLKTSTSRAAPSTLQNKCIQILRLQRWLCQPAENMTTAKQGMWEKLFGIFIIVNYGDENTDRTPHLLPQENCIQPGSLLEKKNNK